nr:protein P200 isoform X1 [Nothobranchius furzeri]XP_054607348.1 protein P200 isoform X1 [Nothobranchius furzeri]XP_054607349.1 protein P200 isoform X1 [Nothobranchius furzeri]
MEEADLLKERLQAITDKRRIQEDITKKRRLIEEEKLKLQYIKKKALREQWLMDGLSQQSEEEQEAMRIQAQDEQQQSDQLQREILRIEKEIKDLETQELNISANEEVVLRRLKEVERTPEDIIKKAVLVETEAEEKELNEGCSKTDIHNFIPVTMETTELSKLVMDCTTGAVADSLELEGDLVAEEELFCLKTDSPDDQREVVSSSSLTSDLPCTTDTDKHDRTESNVCTRVPCQDSKEKVISEQDHDELIRKESVNSSDTISSADSVYEVQPQCQRQIPPEQALEQESDQCEDPEISPSPKLYQQLLEDSNVDQLPEPELEQEPEFELKEDYEMGFYPEPELEPEIEPKEDYEMGFYPDLEQDPEPEHNTEFELYTKQDPEVDPEVEVYQNQEFYPENSSEVYETLSEQPFQDESILEQCIREEALSDVSNESYHNPEDIDECLKIEIAASLSDSDTDDKWRAIFSSSINKEDDDSYLDSLQLSAQELFVQKTETSDVNEEDGNNFEEVCFEVPKITEVLEQPEDIASSPVPPQEVKYCPLGLQGLSKISEDESENGRDANHNHTKYQESFNADTVKRLPKDFCVIQETKSENVSMEHVDFQLARKQWREMEEQMKNKILLPSTKKSSLQSSHSFMYTPVRNIERTHMKTRDLENLNLVGDYSHTQFSPCSEDSGLDDSSYRSPYDDPETSVEREIRLSVEREENFKRERGLSRMGKSTDCAPSRSIPRSISTPLTPSFIITSSPTKEPLKHEVSANNVIILDPRNEFTSKDNITGRSGEWCPEESGSSLIILETSNLIIRSASEFSLNKACEQPQEKIFLNNPFFKLRSRSSISLVDEEIKVMKQREEELRKERAKLYGKERLGADKSSSNPMDTLAFDNSVVPVKCKSSPSSPMKSAHRMDRSALSCDHRFPDAFAGGRRKSAMALRWEAGEFTKD